MNPVGSLRCDLVASGFAKSEVAALARRYEQALRAPSDASWTQFYAALFGSMRELATSVRPGSAAARRAILRILEDDLGTRLFDADSLVDLRDAVLRCHPEVRAIGAPRRGESVLAHRRVDLARPRVESAHHVVDVAKALLLQPVHQHGSTVTVAADQDHGRILG